MTSNSGHWVLPSGASLGINEYSANGWKFGQGSGYLRIKCDYTPSFPFECSFEVVSKGTYDILGGLADAFVNFMGNNNSIQIRTSSSYNSYNVSVVGKWTIKFYSDKFAVYREGTYIGERNYDSTQIPEFQFDAGTQSGRWIQVKDLKIKEL